MMIKHHITGEFDEYAPPSLCSGFFDEIGEFFGFGGSDPVPSVDPAALAAAQAEANRITQFLPGGTLTFGQTQDVDGLLGFQPDVGGAALQLVESDAQRGLRELAEQTGLQLGTRAQTEVAGLPSGPLDVSGLPPLAPEGLSPETAAASVFEQGLGFLEPVFETREQRLLQDFVNAGTPIGSDIANERLRMDAEFRNKALSDLALSAIQFGGAEESRIAALQAGQRLQGLQERQTIRNQQFNEVASLLGLNPVPQQGLSNFVPPAQVDVTGPQQLAQNVSLANFNAQEQRRRANLGGLFDIAAALV